MLPVRRDAAPTPSQSSYASGVPTDDFTVSGFAGVLRRHRWLILVCVVVALALAAAYTMYAAPAYEASSMLRVDEQQVNLPQLVQQVSTENEISTEIEVLQRRSAALPVIDSLALRAKLASPRNGRASKYFSLLKLAPDADTATLSIHATANGTFSVSTSSEVASAAASSKAHASARIGDTIAIGGVTFALRPAARTAGDLRLQITSVDAAVRRFAGMLKVTRPTRDADLIAIRVKSSDPIQAAAAANVLAEEVIANRQDVQLARTGSTVGFLRQQLDTLGKQLRSAEDQLQSYRQNARVVDANEQARTQVGRLAQVQAERAGVEAERDALSMLLDQIHADSVAHAGAGSVGVDSSRARRLIAFPTLFRNQAASQLLGSLAQVENERSTLLTRRTAQDPDVLVLTNRIHSLDAQLEGIASTYLQGLTNQVSSLETESRRFGGSLDSLPAKQVETARLERAVRVQQELYTLIQTRLKEAEITEAMKDPSIRVVDRAVAPDKPTWPNPLLNYALAPILGLLVGIALALVRESTDQSVRSRADALFASGLPILGAIPRLRRPNRLLRGLSGRARLRAGNGDANAGKHSPRLPMARAATSISALFATDPDAPADYVEAFNHLHANLELAYEDRPVKSLVITSPLPGEGKTLTAVNYALTLAGQGYRVLLIDADLRCGLVNEIFGIPREPGVSEILREATDFDTAARRVNVGGGGVLTVLPSGARGPTPGRLLVVDKLRELLGVLHEQFDYVIIDSPPINLLADASLLGAASDAVLLVVRAGHTRIEELRYAMDQLTAARAPVIGTLLNDIDPNRRADDESYRYLQAVNRYADSGEGLARLGR